MKKVLFLFIVLCQSIFTCFSQGEKILEGLVLTYQEEKAIRTRDIYVRHLISRDTVFVETYSDFNGKFSIVFPNKTRYPTGIIVRGSGEFKDYKVVNTYDINNIKETDTNVNVFIGNKNVINKQKELFYDIITQPIVKQYQDSIQYYQSIIWNLELSENIYIDSIKKLNDIIKNLGEDLDNKEQRNKVLSEQLEQTRLELILLKENPLIQQNETYENNSHLLIEAFDFWSKGEIEKASQCIPKYLMEGSNLNIKESKLYFSFLQLSAMIDEADGKIDSAVMKYREALLQIRKDGNGHEDEFKHFSTYMSIAELENILKNYDKAIDNLHKASERKVNDIYKIKTYNLWGKILESQGKKGEKFHKKYKIATDSLYKKLKKETIIDGVIDNDHIADKEAAISYALLADYYNENKRYQKAKANYHKAVNIYTELNKIGEYEAEAQSVLLLKLMAIYANENKVSMVNKLIERLNILLEIDSTLAQNPKRNLRLAIYYMQNENFKEADKMYTMVLDSYKKNQNLYQQELIKTLFLCGLNHFYAGSYQQALNYFSQTDSLANNSTLSRVDFVRITALCMAAEGVILERQGEGSFRYDEAIDRVTNGNDQYLDDNYKKSLLKDMADLKKYGKSKTIDTIMSNIGSCVIAAASLVLLINLIINGI